MPSPFEDELRAFDRAERDSPSPTNAVVFYGSSSIRLWTTLKQDFRAFTVIHRGYGGSTLRDCADQVERVVNPLVPRLIVLYAGDNDLEDGQSPEAVLASFQDLLARKRRVLPEVPLAFLSIKPAMVRWHNGRTIRRANALIEDCIRRERDAGASELSYLDIFHPMLDGAGRPRPELFVEDGLHLNGWGYRLWTAVVSAWLETWVACMGL